MEFISGKWKLTKSDKLTILFDILNIRGLKPEEANELSKLTGIKYQSTYH